MDGPSNGSLGALQDDACAEGSGDTATVTYTPAPYANGPDSFTYRVSDGELDSGTATATISVGAVNDIPVVSAGPDASVRKKQSFIREGSFADPDADSWTATVSFGDGGGVQPLSLSGKTFALQHTYAKRGTYPVTVCVRDSGDATGCGSFTITVTT